MKTRINCITATTTTATTTTAATTTTTPPPPTTTTTTTSLSLRKDGTRCKHSETWKHFSS